MEKKYFMKQRILFYLRESDLNNFNHLNMEHIMKLIVLMQFK